MTFEVHQEPDALPRGKLVAVYVGAVLITALAILCAWLLMGATNRAAIPRRPPVQAAPHQIATVEQTPIRATARGLDEKMRAREALGQWRWVDRDAGVAEIPIDVAMDVVARGAAEKGGAR